MHDDSSETEEEEEPAMSDSNEDAESIISNEDDITSTSETEDGEDSWDEIVNHAFEDCQLDYEEKVKYLMESEDLDKTTAQIKAFKELRPLYRKAIMRYFVEKMIWFNEIKQDRIFNAIKKTALNLKQEEDYGIEEAWKYSASKRKYLFDEILKQYVPPEVSDTEQMDTDDEEDENIQTLAWFLPSEQF